MNVHSIQFDRPLVNVALVGDVDDSDLSVVSGDDSSIDDAHRRPADPTLLAGDSELLQRLIEGISTGVQNVNVQTESLMQEFKELSVRLALMMTRRLIGDSDTVKSERLLRLLDEAMHHPEPIVAVWIHPDFELRVRESLDKNVTVDTLPEIKTDKALVRGECRIEFSAHELISNLELQFAEIESRLMEVVANVDH